MGKKILLCCVLVSLMAAAAAPLEVFADGDPLASPTPLPIQRVTAPVISGVNPQVVLPEGDLGDINPSGGPIFPEPLPPIWVAPPVFVDLQPAVIEERSALPADGVSCGPAALAQALDILSKEDGREVPGARQLETFLRDRGLMYAWGTGVEELVYAARSNGYPGTRSQHNWNLEALIRELEKGYPVVVSLGINGPDQPGHFVVLTGVSSDGKWITCLDPSRGKLQLTQDDFLSLWELQGRAGVVFSDSPLPASADTFLPWMGLFSTLSVLGLTLNQRGEIGLARENIDGTNLRHLAYFDGFLDELYADAGEF